MANREQWAVISTGTTSQVLTCENALGYSLPPACPVKGQVLTIENGAAVWRFPQELWPAESKAVLQLGTWELKVNHWIEETQYTFQVVTIVLICVMFVLFRLGRRLARTEALLRRFNISDQK